MRGVVICVMLRLLAGATAVTLWPAGSCPSLQADDELAVLLPHRLNCSAFYICSWGTPVPMSCPPGLHFNPELRVCDWPSAAGCRAQEPPVPGVADLPGTTSTATPPQTSSADVDARATTSASSSGPPATVAHVLPGQPAAPTTSTIGVTAQIPRSTHATPLENAHSSTARAPDQTTAPNQPTGASPAPSEEASTTPAHIPTAYTFPSSATESETSPNEYSTLAPDDDATTTVT